MTAGDDAHRIVGVRVLATTGPMKGATGVVVRLGPHGWYWVQWDDAHESVYRTAYLVPESQALANIRLLP